MAQTASTPPPAMSQRVQEGVQGRWEWVVVKEGPVGLRWARWRFACVCIFKLLCLSCYYCIYLLFYIVFLLICGVYAIRAMRAYAIRAMRAYAIRAMRPRTLTRIRKRTRTHTRARTQKAHTHAHAHTHANIQLTSPMRRLKEMSPLPRKLPKASGLEVLRECVLFSPRQNLVFHCILLCCGQDRICCWCD